MTYLPAHFTPLQDGKPVRYQLPLGCLEPELSFHLEEIWRQLPGGTISGADLEIMAEMSFSGGPWMGLGAVWKTYEKLYGGAPYFHLKKMGQRPPGDVVLRFTKTTTCKPRGLDRVGIALEYRDSQGHTHLLQPLAGDAVQQSDVPVICPAVYRRYKNGDFDYAGVSCPYAGDRCYDKYGIHVRQRDDDCAKSIEACRLRFPDGPLPFGVSKI